MKIEHHADDQQFTVINNKTVGFLTYTTLPEGKTLDYQHTFVQPEFRGKHIGQDLVKFALDYANNNIIRLYLRVLLLNYLLKSTLNIKALSKNNFVKEAVFLVRMPHHNVIANPTKVG